MDEAEKDPKKLMIESMFQAGAQYGYRKSRRHPSAKPFVFGVKNNTEIFNLEVVYDVFMKARDFVEKLGRQGKTVLFVGNKPEARDIVIEAAKKIGMPYARERWIGGTCTNFAEMKKRLARLDELRVKGARGELSVYSKKEQLDFAKEVKHLERYFEGLLALKSLPDALFVVDPREEHTAVREAKKIGIPVVALANSDCDISKIDYPIVANDAARTSVRFFVDEIAKAYERGKEHAVASGDVASVLVTGAEPIASEDETQGEAIAPEETEVVLES